MTDLELDTSYGHHLPVAPADVLAGPVEVEVPRDREGSFHGPPAPCPWWHEVSTDAFQSAFIDADTAFGNWFDSPAGPSCRPGRRLLAVQEEGPGPGREGGHGEGPFQVS